MTTQSNVRGFALLDKKALREISRKGGLMAHQQGLAHRFTKEEAQEAGRKGGLTTAAKCRAAKLAAVNILG